MCIKSSQTGLDGASTMLQSQPSTPLPGEPSNESDYRFEPLRDPVEWIESYRPGGLHPIHLGDTLRDGRYEVIRKLGYGAFSTVWLAQDSISSTLVALKVARADTPSASHEAQIYEQIKRCHVERHLKERIVTLLDSFVHSGPNGEHQCLVFQPMGPSTNSVLESEMTSNDDESVTRYMGAKTIIKQLLLGLHFLHSNGIAHGDVNPGNLLLSLRELTVNDPPQFVQQPTGDNISEPVKRKDGKPDRWAPKYLCADRPITRNEELSASVDIKLSDLGAAFFIASPPAKSVTPVALRAPEIIFKMPFDHRIDIWSFGCLAFQFITNIALFVVCDWGGTPAEETDDDHLLQMITALGQLPARLTNNWDRHNKYFSQELELIRSDVGPEEVSEFPVHIGQTIEELFDEQRPNCMGSDEARKVLSFLKRVLRYEPDERPSTADMLEDEWIRSIG